MIDPIILKFLRRYTKQYRVTLLYVTVFSILQSVLLIPSVFFIKQIFDQNLPEQDMQGLLLNAAAIAAITLSQGLLGLLHRITLLRVVKKAISTLQKEVLTTLIQADKAFFDQKEGAAITNAAISDVEKTDKMIDGFLGVAIPQFFLFIIGLLTIFVYNPLIGLCTLTLGVVGLLTRRKIRRKIYQFIEASVAAKDNLTAYVNFLPSKQVLIKMRDNESQELEEALKLSDPVIQNGMRTAVTGKKVNVYDELIINLSAILLIILGSIQILYGAASYGNIFGLYFLIVFIRRTATTMQAQWLIVQEGKVALRRLLEMLPSSELSYSQPHQKSEAFTFEGGISIEKASFGYGREAILEDIYFQINAGEIVSIIGDNGSGKSSLINLILGFYPPASGAIYADSIAYSKLHLGTLRSHIGYVPQNQVMISGSILDNITYGLNSSDKKELDEFLDSSFTKKLLEPFAKGLKTQVVREGDNLSGGQVQRISILRALASKPKLLILDEPTNHLDGEAVIALIKELQALQQISILIVSHHNLFREIIDKCYHLTQGRLSEVLKK